MILWCSLKFSRSASAAVCQPLHLQHFGERAERQDSCPHVLIGTPGRMLALLREKDVTLGAGRGQGIEWKSEGQTWMIIPTSKYYSLKDQTCLFAFDHQIQVPRFHAMSSSASNERHIRHRPGGSWFFCLLYKGGTTWNPRNLPPWVNDALLARTWSWTSSNISSWMSATSAWTRLTCERRDRVGDMCRTWWEWSLLKPRW